MRFYSISFWRTDRIGRIPHRVVTFALLAGLAVALVITGCTTTPTRLQGKGHQHTLTSGMAAMSEDAGSVVSVELRTREVRVSDGVQTILEVEATVENISSAPITVDPSDVLYLHLSSQRVDRRVTDREFKQVRMIMGDTPIETDAIEVWPAAAPMEYAAFLSQTAIDPPDLNALLRETVLEPGASVTGTVGFVRGASITYMNAYQDTDALRASPETFTITPDTQIAITKGNTSVDIDRLGPAHTALTTHTVGAETIDTFQEVSRPNSESERTFGKPDFYLVYTVEPDWITMREHPSLLVKVNDEVHRFSLAK